MLKGRGGVGAGVHLQCELASRNVRTEVNHIAPKGLPDLGAVELDNGEVFDETFRAGAESDRRGADDVA